MGRITQATYCTTSLCFFVLLLVFISPVKAQQCGDVNDDWSIDAGDIAYLFDFLWGYSFIINDYADLDDYELITIRDVMFLESWMNGPGSFPTCPPTQGPLKGTWSPQDYVYVDEQYFPADETMVTLHFNMNTTRTYKGLMLPFKIRVNEQIPTIGTVTLSSMLDSVTNKSYKVDNDSGTVMIGGFTDVWYNGMAPDSGEMATVEITMDPADTARHITVVFDSLPPFHNGAKVNYEMLIEADLTTYRPAMIMNIPALNENIGRFNFDTISFHGFYTDTAESAAVFDFDNYVDELQSPYGEFCFKLKGQTIPVNLHYGGWGRFTGTLDYEFDIAGDSTLDSAVVTIDLDDIEVWEDAEYWPPDTINLDVGTASNINREQVTDSSQFGLIISGGITVNGNLERYWRNTDDCFTTWNQYEHFPRGHIKTVYADGKVRKKATNNSGLIDEVIIVATESLVNAAVTDLAAKLAAFKADHENVVTEVQVMVTDHGQSDGDIVMYAHEKLISDIDRDEFKDLMQQFVDKGPDTLKIIMLQCYAGKPAVTLRELDLSQGTEVSIVSAANPDKKANELQRQAYKSYLKLIREGSSVEYSSIKFMQDYQSLVAEKGWANRYKNQLYLKIKPFPDQRNLNIKAERGGFVYVEFQTMKGKFDKKSDCEIKTKEGGTFVRKKKWAKKYGKAYKHIVPGGISDPLYENIVLLPVGKDFKVIVSIKQPGFLRPYDRQLLSLDDAVTGGFWIGVNDESATEFGTQSGPYLRIENVDAIGWIDSQSPREFGSCAGVDTLVAGFSVDSAWAYWQYVDFVIKVNAVFSPGSITIQTPGFTNPSHTIFIDTVGTYNVTLGSALYDGYDSLRIEAGATCFDVDYWGILESEDAPPCCQVVGDLDHYGSIEITDLTVLVDYMFRGGSDPICTAEADMDGDGEINISDLTYLVDYMFRLGPEPLPCPTLLNLLSP